MKRNIFANVNDHIFAELERLESAKGDELEAEIERARAVGALCHTAIGNANSMMRAVTMQHELAGRVVEMPRMLAGGDD